MAEPRPTRPSAAPGEAMPPVLGRLSGQPAARRFLAAATTGGHLSHAYLFLGAPGAGKLEAARALAQCVVCPNGGCGACDECVRVAHGTHPDVRVLRPASASGYLVEQVRELVDDVALAPVRAHAKVYILQEGGLVRGAAANALLKTIEEPPDGVMFVICARTVDAVLPTIASRCQHVPFSMPASAAATHAVELASGVGGWEARMACAVAGTPERAAEFLASAQRRACRRLVVRAIGELARDDAWDVLVSAREIVAAVRAPLDAVRTNQEELEAEQADFLGAGALRKVADAHKRELTARERSGMMEALAAAESLLRDVLLRLEGATEPVVNEDASDVVDRIAQASTTAGALGALAAVGEAAGNLERNVSPQLTVEVMLLRVKEALYAHRHTGEV